MGKIASRTASFEELMRAGSPVDLSVAAQTVEKMKVEIEQVGGIHDSMVFELEGGRVAVMADIAVTNQTSRPIDVIDVELEAPWGDSLWHWLEPTEIKFRDRAKGDCSFPLYRFPSKCAMDLPYDQVINHILVERHRLPGKRRLEGWLLGIGGRMPAKLYHGQWLEFSLVITTSDHTEYEERLQLWTDRLEARVKAVAARTNLFERDTLPTREVGSVNRPSEVKSGRAAMPAQAPLAGSVSLPTRIAS